MGVNDAECTSTTPYPDTSFGITCCKQLSTNGELARAIVGRRSVSGRRSVTAGVTAARHRGRAANGMLLINDSSQYYSATAHRHSKSDSSARWWSSVPKVLQGVPCILMSPHRVSRMLRMQLHKAKLALQTITSFPLYSSGASVNMKGKTTMMVILSLSVKGTLGKSHSLGTHS